MSLSLILLVVLIVAAIAAVPAWPHSRNWGYVPLSLAGVALLVVIVLILLGIV